MFEWRSLRRIVAGHGLLLLLIPGGLILQGCATQGGAVASAPQTRLPRPTPTLSTPAKPAAIPEPAVRTMPLERAVPSPPEAMPMPEAMPESVAEPATAPANPVVVSLLQQADQFAQAGKLDRAAASVERGLRIAPKDAALWQRLASIKLQQGDYRQAESMARKSIALARGHRGMIADNWKIIAQAREQRGDQQGAILAREKSLQFRTPGF